MRNGRNDPCRCGSGKKHKHCCLRTPNAAPPEADAASGWRGLLARATLLHSGGQMREAIEAYEQVLEQRPRNATALAGLGQIHAQLGRPEQAIELLEQAVAIDAKNVRCHVQLGAALGQAGRLEEAQRSAAKAIELDPKCGPAQTMLALTAARMNDVQKAIVEGRKAVALSPGNVDAEVVLASALRRDGALDEAVQRLERLLEHEQRPDRRARVLHELGFARDARGEHDVAFDAFAGAGRETAQTQVARWIDANVKVREIDASRAKVTPALLSRWTRTDFDDAHPAPAFLVGFPRSGTTMLEQVLGSHPGVVTLEERPTIAAIRRSLEQLGGGPGTAYDALARLDREGAQALRAEYWQRVAEELGGTVPTGSVVVDKMPISVTDAGLINALFPEARLIVAIRDPRDVCLSCFMQSFQLNESMIHFLDFERTASFYARVMGLWLHQRPMLTLRWIELRYEQAVEDLEPHARQMLETLGLPWDPAVLRFYERGSKRHANTPSFAAVREPVHTRAVGRWRRYADRFDAVRETLAPFVEAFGYEPFSTPREAA